MALQVIMHILHFLFVGLPTLQVSYLRFGIAINRVYYLSLFLISLDI